MHYHFKIFIVSSIFHDLHDVSCKNLGPPCPSDFKESDSGGCFKVYSNPSGAFDFGQAQMQCRMEGAFLVSILDEVQNDFIVKWAKDVQKETGETHFWLGLHCYQEFLKWTEHCYAWYRNLKSNDEFTVVSYDDRRCDGDPHFIFDLEDSTDNYYYGCESDVDSSDLSRMYVIVSIIVAVSFVVVFAPLIAVCGILVVRDKRDKEKEENLNAEEENKKKWRDVLEHTSELRYTSFPGLDGVNKESDVWEIDRRHVSIDFFTTKLGQGAFGSVYLGIVDNSNIPSTGGKTTIDLAAWKRDNNAVAVKMLHESADKLQQMMFFDEIYLMKRLGYHEKLVNMVACVANSSPALLIIEYCSHGDLLSYMRERRQFMFGTTDEISSIDRSKIITQKQQLMFCVQITYGMEYLSQRGFVHRDIAARNILVDQHESCKIGDFGLCREVEKQDEHYHSRGGRLPLKWMSPEAIERYDFSIASDVWAYGVLLFEIITLGGNPYPDWPAAEILDRLKRGRRMDRPENCTDHMFAVMNSCWLLTPEDRPTFSELRMKMGTALEEVSEDDYYLKLNARSMYYCTQSEIEEEIEVVDEERTY